MNKHTRRFDKGVPYEQLLLCGKKILFAALCVIVLGCVDEDAFECNSTLSYPYWTEWDAIKLVSIVDDSLAILSSQRFKTECKSDDYEVNTASRSGLFLVNYRKKQEPLSVSTYEYSFREDDQVHSHLNIIGNYFKDSSVLAFDMRDHLFGFWKIGEKDIFFKKYAFQESYRLERAKPWENKNILFTNPKDYNTDTLDIVPMLNPSNGQISMIDLPTEYGLNECLDVSYIGGKVVCIRANKETKNYELVANGTVTDSTPIFNFYSGEDINNILFYGNYLIKNITVLPDLTNFKEILKIDEESLKFSSNFKSVLVHFDTVLKRESHSADFDFYDDYNDLIRYKDTVLVSGDNYFDFKLKNPVTYTRDDLYRASH